MASRLIASSQIKQPPEYRAISPRTSMPLHEICAACGRQVSGTGFVILDHEELGALCDPDFGDRYFRSYLHEAPNDEGA